MKIIINMSSPVLLILSSLKQDQQKCAGSFKGRQDERDLTVRLSNDDRPPVPALEVVKYLTHVRKKH